MDFQHTPIRVAHDSVHLPMWRFRPRKWRMLLRELGRDVDPEIYGDAASRVTAGATGSWTRQLDQRVAKTAFLATEDFGYCEKWPHESNV